MSFSIEQLRAATDDKLIELHDQHAEHTVIGVSYYLDELRRREQARVLEASDRLARRSFWLTLADAPQFPAWAASP